MVYVQGCQHAPIWWYLLIKVAQLFFETLYETILRIVIRLENMWYTCWPYAQ